MGYLNSEQIKEAVKRKKIVIDPYFDFFQGPNLYYCHLGRHFLVPKKGRKAVDPMISNDSKNFRKVTTDHEIIIKSGQFLLAETFEFFYASDDMVIRLFNSSSLARVGVSHCALGMINPGCGKYKPVRLTLELVNNAPYPVCFRPTVVKNRKVIRWGTEVLKVGIVPMDKKVNTSYSDWKSAIYQDDVKVQGSKMHIRYSVSKEFILPKKSLALN
jgi:deoxycytidine triphosphate deaminase